MQEIDCLLHKSYISIIGRLGSKPTSPRYMRLIGFHGNELTCLDTGGKLSGVIPEAGSAL